MSPLLHRLNARLRPAERALDPVIHAIVRTLVTEAAGAGVELDEHALNVAAQAMRGRIGLMPRFLGLPMAGATLFFDATGALSGGLPFRMLPQERRQRVVELWRKAPISFFQDFLEFYGKMGIFVYFSEVAPEGGEDEA
ncbi:MAG: hypothetical protein ABIO70_35720 [Pseudomonadota bacterium]